MPNSIPTPPASFIDVVKHPVTYALIIIVSLLSFFVYKFSDTSALVNDNCEAEKKELRKDLERLRAEKEALYTSILIKNGIILQQKIENEQIDSTLRSAVGTKAKRIVKEK